MDAADRYDGPVVQRTESAELLKELARPQVMEFPEAENQNVLIAKLEGDEMVKDAQEAYGAFVKDNSSSSRHSDHSCTRRSPTPGT
jgi:hypothetical protein